MCSGDRNTKLLYLEPYLAIIRWEEHLEVEELSLGSLANYLYLFILWEYTFLLYFVRGSGVLCFTIKELKRENQITLIKWHCIVVVLREKCDTSVRHYSYKGVL
jgi:hypothetical protein